MPAMTNRANNWCGVSPYMAAMTPSGMHVLSCRRINSLQPITATASVAERPNPFKNGKLNHNINLLLNELKDYEYTVKGATAKVLTFPGYISCLC